MTKPNIETESPLEIAASKVVAALAETGADDDESRYRTTLSLLAMLAAWAGKLPDQVVTDLLAEMPHGYVAVVEALTERTNAA